MEPQALSAVEDAANILLVDDTLGARVHRGCKTRGGRGLAKDDTYCKEALADGRPSNSLPGH